jgi:hypothetical protein
VEKDREGNHGFRFDGLLRVRQSKSIDEFEENRGSKLDGPLYTTGKKYGTLK